MNTAQRIAKNTTILFLSQVISYILIFFYTIYIARYLGADRFGILSLALALTGIFVIFTDLGLSNLTVREVARDKSHANKYLGNITVIKIILAFLTFGIIILTAKLFNYPQQVSYIIYLIMLSSIFASFSGLFYSIFQAYEKMEYQSIATILNSILMFLGVIILIYYKLSLVYFASIYILINGICLIYSLAICIWKFFIPKLEIDWIFWKPIIIEALPLSVALLFSVIGFRIDSVLLSIMKGNVAVGFYSASYKFIEALTFFPSVFTVAIYPVMSNFYISSHESLKKSYENSFKYLSILGLPIAVGTTLLADKLILIVYGSGYSPSIIALQILIWQVPLVFLTYFFGTLFVSINKQKVLLKILFICMNINIILNIILIPTFSYLAASLVTVITELVSFILCFNYLSKFICKIKIHKYITNPIIASIIMGLSILFFKVDTILVIIISPILYFLVLILLKTFSQEDINLIKQIIHH